MNCVMNCDLKNGNRLKYLNYKYAKSKLNVLFAHTKEYIEFSLYFEF